jgi:probable rRNA maturation factor
MASQLPPKKALVEISLVGERRMAELNRVYRSKRGASEILTFSYIEDPEIDPGAENPVGEIYLCWQRLIGGARRRRVSQMAYLLRLFAHGLCHLQGYRHNGLRSTKRMEKLEKELLSRYLSEAELARLFV